MTSVNREVIIMSRRVDFRILVGVDGSAHARAAVATLVEGLGRMPHEFERSSQTDTPSASSVDSSFGA